MQNLFLEHMSATSFFTCLIILSDFHIPSASSSFVMSLSYFATHQNAFLLLFSTGVLLMLVISQCSTRQLFTIQTYQISECSEEVTKKVVTHRFDIQKAGSHHLHH